MDAYWADDSTSLHHGDCLDVMRQLPDCSVDAIVCDPPYGLANTTPAQVAETLTAWVSGDREYLPTGKGFMGRSWDAFVPPVAVWDEALRVLKPGGHLLAFAGSRTHDLMSLGIRLAGFDIRDSIAWLYGSGMPKSLDVSKAVDTHVRYGGSSQKQQRQRDMGADYEPHPLAGTPGFGDGNLRKGADGNTQGRKADVTSPEGQQWAGWGTALKPAFEPIVVARKPLQGTVAANVMQWGTGGLNIDGCRVTHASADDLAASQAKNPGRADTVTSGVYGAGRPQQSVNAAGRWPTNVLLDGDAAAELDAGQPTQRDGVAVKRNRDGKPQGTSSWSLPGEAREDQGYGGQGGPSRFFPTFRYQAKAPTRERPKVDGIAHPTCKPLELMRWLVRLVTPPGGVVLEPFAGSGTTVEAARLEGFRCIAIEREADYLPLILARIERAKAEPREAPVVYERPAGNGRDGEASAERRYAAKGGTNFAMKPGPRYDRKPVRIDPLPLVDGDHPLPLFELDDDGGAA